jgi:putative transposase
MAWQEGFGAFSYAESEIKNVVRYILNQKTHHQKVTFKKEFDTIHERFGVECPVEYRFKEPE